MKYTCQLSGNSLDELGIPKNPYFDPSYASLVGWMQILECTNIVQTFSYRLDAKKI